MKYRRWFAAVWAAVALCACSVPDQSTPAPQPSDWARVTAYLAAHPVPHRRGMVSGVLIQAAISGYRCLGGTCQTWSGLIAMAGGQAMRAFCGDADAETVCETGISQDMFPGDYLYVPTNGVIRNPEDFRVIKHGAVGIG